MATPAPYVAPSGTSSLFVAATGSDSTGNGSSGSPYATILKASQVATPGTVVMVSPGTYAGGFATLSNGTSFSHISYFSTTLNGAVIGGVGTGVVTTNNAAWENRGNFVDIIGFVIDGSANANGTKPWQFGYYNGGSNCSFVLGVVHDIMTNVTYYNNQTASGNGGAGIENDYFYGGSGSSVSRTTVYNIGPPGLKSSLVQVVYQSQQNGTVSDCLLYNSVGAGVELWHAASVITIANNTIYGMGNVGIAVGSGDAGSTTTTGSNCIVNNNIVVNCASGGIGEFGTTGTSTALPTPTPTPSVMTAKQFIDTLGVVTQMTNHTPQYTNVTTILANINYLGLHHVREGVNATLSDLTTLAQGGIKFDFLAAGGGTYATSNLLGVLGIVDQVATAVPGSIAAVEGANEINNFALTYNGVAGLQGAVNLQQDIFTKVHADPLLSTTAVYYFTGYGAGGFAQGPNPATTPGLADYDTQHPYPLNGNPPLQWVNRTQALSNETPATGPAVYTETGYSSTTAFGANIGTAGQAKYTLDLLMDCAQIGIAHTYLYELMEQGDGLGLFDASGVAKPAAVAIHNLTTILADSGTVPAGAAAASYSVSGLPASGHSMALMKSNGATDIVVWAEPQITLTTSGPPVTVFVSLGATYQTALVFDPLLSAAPIQTLTNVSGVTLSITDHPLIVEVQGRLTTTANVYNNNLVFNNSGFSIQLQHGLIAANTVGLDPLFVNPTTGNFQLQSGSPAINHGIATATPPTDLLGYANPPTNGYTIGAYNFTGGTLAVPRIVAPLTGTVTIPNFAAADYAVPGVTLPSGKPFHYEIMMPSQYSTNFIWPLMIWLHPDGSGNAWYQGQASQISVNDASPQYRTVAFQTKYPSIVIVPYADQTTASSDIQNWGGWINTGATGSGTSFNGETGPNTFALNGLVQHLIATLSIDPNRIYVNGFSLGGIGAEYFMLRYNQVNGSPKIYTAGTSTGGVLEIHGFGAGPTAADVTNQAQVPVWWISGQNDGTSVPTHWNTLMWQQQSGNSSYPALGSSEAASRAGSSKYHFWYAAGVGHSPTDNSGNYMESYSQVLDWLFAQVGTLSTGGTGKFLVSGGQIIDPNGNIFKGGGINVRDDRLAGIVTNAACTPLLTLFPGTNIVRVFYEAGNNPYVLNQFEPAVGFLTAKGIVVLIEDHTGVSQPPYTGAALTRETNWYSSLATTYKNNPYVWFGTFNEPGNGTNLPGIWTQEVAIYNAVRGTGNNTIIALEEPSGGNVGLVGTNAVGYDGSAPMTTSAAGMHNVVWDYHTYPYLTSKVLGSYTTDKTQIRSVIMGSVASASGILACQSVTSDDGLMPVIIGEFGESTDAQTVDPNAVPFVDVVGTLGYSFVAWVWDPDPPADKLVVNGALTSYGSQVAGLIKAFTSGTTPPTFTPSPNNTVVTAPSNAIITDSVGNTFQIVNAQISINGVVDTTTANVVMLAYVNNVLWHKNTAGNWYNYLGTPGSYGGPTTTSPLPTPSVSGSFITAPTSALLIDNNYVSWGIDSTGGITKNGTAVTEPGGPVVLTPSSGGSVTDGGGHVWTLTSAGAAVEDGTAVAGGTGTGALTVSNGTLYGQDANSKSWYTWNGTGFVAAATAPPTAAPATVELAYVTNLIWEKNAVNNWYSTTDGVAWTGPTTTSPLSTVPGGLFYILPMKQAGIRVITNIKQESPASFATGLTSLRNEQATNHDIFAYEGCQEPDTAVLTGTPETLSDAASFQQTVWNAGQADSLPVIQTSFGVTSNYGTTGNLSAFATYGNAHTYTGTLNASPNGGPAPGFLSVVNADALLTSPGRGIAHTEFGWLNDHNTEAAIASYVLDFVMSGFFDLDVPFYIYSALFDDSKNGQVGLFNANQTPRLAATALSNMFTLLKDTAVNALSFGPGLLNFSISNLPASPSGTLMGGKTGVLQKSDGSFWIMVRNEQALTTSDATGHIAVTVAAITCGLTLGTIATSIAVYDPLVGTTAVQTAANTSAVNFSLPAHPILIKVVRP